MPSTLVRRTALTVAAAAVLTVAAVIGGRLETTTQVISPTSSKASIPRLSAPASEMAQNQQLGASAAVATAPFDPAFSASPSLSSSADVANLSNDVEIVQLRLRSLVIPVQKVTGAQLQDTFTQARAGGVPHDAMDIMAPRGTPVLAVEDGRIAKLFLSKPGGVTLYQFDPDSNYAYYYAHLDSYAANIAEGASVTKGQVLGHVGSTGNASPDAPHLHFAIFKLGPERQWWRGSPINPYLVWRDAKP